MKIIENLAKKVKIGELKIYDRIGIETQECCPLEIFENQF